MLSRDCSNGSSKGQPQGRPIHDGGGQMFIDVNAIEANPHQPRTSFDMSAIQALAGTMSEHGLINPISVSGPYQDGRYVLHDGERRVMAAKLLGWTEIEASVKPVDVADVELAFNALIANLQREDMGPIDEAKAYHRLREMGYSTISIAQSVGVSESNVSSRLRMLELHPDVQELFNQGKLPRHENLFTQLRQLAPDVQVKIARRAAAMGLTAARILALISRKTRANPKVNARVFERAKKAEMADAPALFLNADLVDRSAGEIREAVHAECRACGMYDDLALCQECPLTKLVRSLASVTDL